VFPPGLTLITAGTSRLPCMWSVGRAGTRSALTCWWEWLR